MTIRVPSAGDAPISGKGHPGDLHVRVSVSPSKLFRRQGINLYHDARVPLHTALLGGKVRVPTLDGEVDVRIPGGTQQGEEMVLKSRGVSSVFGGDKGDIFVTFTIQMPRYVPSATHCDLWLILRRSLTKKQREILQQYADDVEGRSTPSTRPTPQPSSQHDSPTSANRDSNSSDDQNGRVSSFESTPSPREGGRLSRAWNSVRRIFGSDSS